jgi:hypothetical protein
MLTRDGRQLGFKCSIIMKRVFIIRDPEKNVISHFVAKNNKSHSDMTIMGEFWELTESLTLMSGKNIMSKGTETSEMGTTTGEVSVPRAYSLSSRRQTPRLLSFAIEFSMRRLLSVWRFKTILSAQRSALLIKAKMANLDRCKIDVDRFSLTVILIRREI